MPDPLNLTRRTLLQTAAAPAGALMGACFIGISPAGLPPAFLNLA